MYLKTDFSPHFFEHFEEHIAAIFIRKYGAEKNEVNDHCR